MKKILIAATVACCVITSASAQTAVAATAVPATTASDAKMSKEEKAAAKAKKEADLTEAFKKAGVTSDEELKAREALNASNEKAKAVKNEATLTDDQKKEKLDAIYKERNETLRAIMGDAKLKIFKETQKAQKEAAKG